MDEAIIWGWFRDSAPTPEQIVMARRINMAGYALATIINESVVDCADKTAAIRKLREAVHTACDAVILGSASNAVK